MTEGQIYTFMFQSEKRSSIFAFPSALCPAASILNKVPRDTSHLRTKQTFPVCLFSDQAAGLQTIMPSNIDQDMQVNDGRHRGEFGQLGTASLPVQGSTPQRVLLHACRLRPEITGQSLTKSTGKTPQHLCGFSLPFPILTGQRS